jgi:hypothetical protein
MSVRQRWYIHGPLFGMRYNFEKAGQGLPRHSHAPELQHDVTVLRGSVSINGKIYATGSTVGIGGEAHDVTAVEDDTETLHMYYNGMPPGYADMPLSERDVEIP